MHCQHLELHGCNSPGESNQGPRVVTYKEVQPLAIPEAERQVLF